MSKFVGAMAATTALVAGVIYRVDPVSSLERAFIAYMLGWAGTTIWQALVSGGGKVITESTKSFSQDENEVDDLKKAA